ncbi:hypothetical protein ACOME3_004842 [Neoechinorhynchus agilis]
MPDDRSETGDEAMAAIREDMMTRTCKYDTHQFIVFGASGDLAHKKIYPTLWLLFRDKFIPSSTTFFGYARSDMSDEQLHDKISSFIPDEERDDTANFELFLTRNKYVRGRYDNADDFKSFRKILDAPRSTTTNLYLWSRCMRMIIEKPFGHDLTSSDLLDVSVRKFLNEEEIYRIDHFLGKEMVQSLLILRFANRIFSNVWDRNSISNVVINFKEDIGTYGRGGYFDKYGIVRDVMQNHLLQILCLVAMDKPASFSADDIRDAKTRVIREILPVKKEDIVVGQYVKNDNLKDQFRDAAFSYTDDPQVSDNSRTATFACIVFYIKNERWDNVPFMVKCGKALNERKTEIRIQFRDSLTTDLFTQSNMSESLNRNELVIRVQPDEAIYMKINNKKPGREFCPETSELDLTYRVRYKKLNLPGAYERLIMDVFSGVQTNFVRSDELHEAWKLFTPLLEIADQMEPVKYPFGVRSLKAADNLCAKAGFVYSTSYVWKP